MLTFPIYSTCIWIDSSLDVHPAVELVAPEVRLYDVQHCDAERLEVDLFTVACVPGAREASGSVPHFLYTDSSPAMQQR